MLKHRLITGAVAMATMLASILLLPTFYFSLALAGLIVAAAWEWARLIGLLQPLPRACYTLLFSLLLWLTYRYVPLDSVLLVAGLGWLMVLGGVMVFPRGSLVWANPWLGAAIGLFVLIPPWIALVAMHGHDDIAGPYLVLFLMAMMWVADSAAYFAGRRFGVRKLAINVSPGKTWEGVAGAVLAVALYGLIAGVALFSGSAIAMFTVLCLITLLFSVVGDLFESLYKRLAGVKDSGTLLPGHGGILDRIDSLTAAAPIFLLELTLAGMVT